MREQVAAPRRHTKKFVVVAALALVAALAAWTATVALGVLHGWGRTTLAPRGDTAAFMRAARHKLDAESRGNVAFALLHQGRPFDEHFVSRGRPVDRDTLFQVASLSKWITAWGVMTLVESGRIDLDAPVSGYLKRWHLPPSTYGNEGVTVRRLLSHTAGLTDGLGYGGFAPGATPQTLEQSLTHASDASPGAAGAVRVGIAPGTEWRYSGGGYTLLQLIIEEVTGEAFNGYMQRAVLKPLGMQHSTFAVPKERSAEVADFFAPDGTPATHYQFTAKAAASLYTSSADLTHFIQAHLPGPNGERPGRGVLRPATLIAMRQPSAASFGADIWGLGVILYAPNNPSAPQNGTEPNGYIIGHDGDNGPAINTAARFDPATGDGIIVLESGNTRLATMLAGEWVFWQSGNVDLFDVLSSVPRALMVLGAGYLAIAIGCWLAVRQLRRTSAG